MSIIVKFLALSTSTIFKALTTKFQLCVRVGDSYWGSWVLLVVWGGGGRGNNFKIPSPNFTRRGCLRMAQINFTHPLHKIHPWGRPKWVLKNHILIIFTCKGSIVFALYFSTFSAFCLCFSAKQHFYFDTVSALYLRNALKITSAWGVIFIFIFLFQGGEEWTQF